MKQTFKFLTLFLLTLLGTTNAWANTTNKFKPGEVIYFDASNSSNWTSANFTTKFQWYWDSGEYWKDNPGNCIAKNTDLGTWMYVVTVPNNAYLGYVQLCRMDPSNCSTQWCYTNNASVDDKGSNNCLYCKSENADWQNTWVPGWKTYVPPMKSLTIANNGTTTISGSGTQASPYIIAAGATIKVKATAALQVDDSNPTFKYKYSVDGEVVQDYGSGNNIYQFAAGTEAHTYAVTVRAYATYNSTDNTAIDASNTIYFKIATYTGLTISDNGAPSMTTASFLSSTEVVQGQSVTITKGTPAAGYELDEITVSGGSLDGTTWTPDANNQSVTVKWKASATYSLVVAAGTGITSVSGGKSDQTIIPFDGGTISATVKEGYEFYQWTADPTENAVFADANSASTTVTVNNGSVTVTANATAKSYDIHYPSGTGYTITNNPATGATDATITFTVTPDTKYSVVVKQDGNTLTKGASNSYSFTMPAHEVTITVETEYQSGWYLIGDEWGSWDTSGKDYPLNKVYRGIDGYYYRQVSMQSNKYFKVHNGTSLFGPSEDVAAAKNTIYELTSGSTKAYKASTWSNIWVVVDTKSTNKRLMVQDAVDTYYTISVSGANDHGSYTLKDEAWDLETNQYSANDTYVLTITTTDAYLPSLTVNGSPVSWKSSTTTTYTYEGKATAATTLAVSYVPHFKVTFGYVSGCSEIQGTYTVKNGGASVTSGSYIINGTELTFTATPNEGYQFDGWYTSASATGDPESTETTYNKTINATTTLYAKFSKKVWTVTVAQTGTGTGTLDPDVGEYQVNQVDGQAFTAIPSVGSWFAGWTINPGSGEWSVTTFKPTSDATITATFTAYTSSFDVTEANVNVGKQATVTFTKDVNYVDPAITYELWNEGATEKVEDGTTFTPTDGGATFVAQVAGTYTVKAIVKQNETNVDEVFSDPFEIGAVYTVNFAVSPIEKGSITEPAATPREDVTLDNAFNISASAGTGYHFNKWTAQPKASFTFADSTTAATTATMTAAAVTSTITANFSPNTYVVKFNANSPTGQQATGKMEDQSFEYDEAAKALTANAFVRLGYNFLGWATTADGTVAHLDKAEVSNLTSDNGGVVNLYAIWQLKNDCSIEVIAPAVEDGTISPSAKVTGANVEGTTYTYTFNPKDNSVTFMNWTITNAICVEGTNERSNPVKIKTYGEATIRANVKENLVSVTLKVLPDDYWGYFKVNGNNVASGTVINVGAKTTATVLGKNTNFGYKFDGFEYTEGYDDLITYDEENGEMRGNGNVGKVTIIAKFSVDTNTGWKLFGNWDNWKNDIAFEKHPDQNTKKIAYVKKELSAGNYQFKIKKPDGTVMGLSNEGEMNGTYHFGWKFNNSYNQGQVCKFNPTQNSTYVFRLDYTDENNPTVTLLFANHWFPKPTTIYFNNKNFEGEWGSPKVRFGCDGGIAEAYTMSLVPGTANLYSYTFPEGYEYFDFWQITDNYGWTGAKDKTNETTYGFHNIGEGDYKIKCATKDDKTDANTETVVKISSSYDDGSYSVKYFHNTVYNSLDASRYTVTYSTKTLTGGTLKVEQWENYDGSARTELNTGGVKVDQSRWITLTATPEIGYKFVKMRVTTQDGATEDHFETTWKYAVQQNITAITAEFEQVNKYTFYVKNTTDTEWNTNKDKEEETRDVYIYYDNGKLDGEGKVSYWGWPGLMATPMDNNHEWYKVEMTNAYFTIGNWILNNGVGPDCPQTIHYQADGGVPKFDGQTMEGKYYEIVQDGSEFNSYKLRAATSTPSFYRVITEDGKYTSNVAKVGEIVSFFATTAGAKLQKSGESGWTDVPNGSISITADNVYVATITDEDVISAPEVYTGNYYIRTDGADGHWGDYKDPSKNNAMTYFTPRQGETYSYYWVKNLGKFDKDESSGSFNVKAKVANDYNDNLAGEIANDANTNIYGNINKTTNGSNVRFSYEPTTNLFKRAILSGSADDSYLNIVGTNIYSDVSCKVEFALDMDTYKTNPKACKLRDISDWVYEMTIYAKVPDVNTAIGVDMYSLYNGNRSTLLDDKVIMAKGTGAATYKLRVTYDFKKNRITTSWSPSSQMITETMTVNADIQFLQNEKGDVSQITIIQDGNDVTVKSLEYLLYVLEIEDPGDGKRKEEHYRISLPFNCRVSDIYGIENYVVLDNAGNPISGDWGIQKYDGETRAAQGWYDNSPIQNFWKWLRPDEIMEAGRGYSISIDKNALKWSTIGEEVTRTICDANGTNCQDVTTTEDRAAHRLYFPSMRPGFDLKNSNGSTVTYDPITCTKTQGNRDIYDSDWRFMGSTAYNNIKTDTVTNERAGEEATPAYLYVLNSAETEYEAVIGTDFIYHSFGAYMFQFHGSIAWNVYTQSQPEVASAPRYSAKQHAPEKMRVDVIEGEEVVAQAFVELNDKATTGFDQKMDLTLMKSSKVARAYTTTEGIDYAANCLPFESTIIPMTVNTLHAGDYTLHLEGAENVAVYLIDYQLQTETLISAGDVAVELAKGSSNERFALRFDVAAAPTDMQNGKGEVITNNGQKTTKLLRNGNIYLINAGRVYNATGAELR